MSSGFKHHIKCVTTKVGFFHGLKLRDRKGNESRDESRKEWSPTPYLPTLAITVHCNLARTLFFLHRLPRVILFLNEGYGCH